MTQKTNKPLAILLVGFLFFLSAISCRFVNSFAEPKGDTVTSATFDKNTINLAIGEMDTVNLSIKSAKNQSDLPISWEYDTSIIGIKKDNYGIIITGLSSGTAVIKATCADRSATCVVTVSTEKKENKIENPYIYLSDDFVSLTPAGEAKRVSAALFGGTPKDINGYTWITDKPSIVSLKTEGNFCWLTGLSEGTAKVTVRHQKAAFAYTFLVHCSTDGKTIPYITTSSNIITVNKSTESEKSFYTDLQNPLSSFYEGSFEYKIVDENGEAIANPPIKITANGKQCNITPVFAGECYIKISHPQALYPLDVLVRIVENIENVFIEPSTDLVSINGYTSVTVGVSLKNVPESGDINVDDFMWSLPETASEFVDYDIFGGSQLGKGDSLVLTGKKTGSFKITVSHPLSSQSRSIIVVVRNTSSNASSSKTYITTSQNYVATYIADEQTTVSITINNASAGDEKDLKWSISSTASDGSSSPVIEYVNGTGSFTSKTSNKSARAALQTATGYAIIKPVNAGEAKITISHPKAVYDTSIVVTVLPSSNANGNTFALTILSPVILLKNGESSTENVTLSGRGKTDSDDSAINWAYEGSSLTISANGKTASISSNASGKRKETITVSHPKAPYPLVLNVLCYDTEEELEQFKTIYAHNTFQTIYIGQNAYLSLSEIGVTKEDKIKWTVKEGLNSTIDFSQSEPLTGIATGLKKGNAAVTATLEGSDSTVTFYLAIKSPGIIDEQKPCYLTTTHNVVTLDKGSSQTIEVSPVNISFASYSLLKWEIEDKNLIDVHVNNNMATIQSLGKEGKTFITVTHPLSNNSLTINVHIGNEYEYKNTDVAFISASSDMVRLKTDSQKTPLTVFLSHTESDETSTDNFTFASSDTSVFTAESSPNSNICNITPKKAGQGILLVKHPEASYDKEVLVIIEYSDADLANVPFLTTSQNVVTVLAGEYTTASVKLENAAIDDPSQWNWTAQNTSIADVVVNNGNTAMISGLGVGTTVITVFNSQCSYPIKLIVICLDSAAAMLSPWIKTTTNVVTLKINGNETVTAEMVGSSSKPSDFSWYCSDSTIALVNASSNAAQIKGLKAGITYITLRNNTYTDSYTKTILVIVEKNTVDECFINVNQKIVKMKPTDREPVKIVASLENAQILDAQDFIWWADDYSLINFTSNTDTVTIEPTGISGTTMLHVKHPKVLNTVDIIVLISSYTSFNFDSPSKTIGRGSISFIPMQVPSSAEPTWIEYESDNSSICAITGSNKVAMIAGVKDGYTTVQAVLKSSKGIIASSSMAIIVTPSAEEVNKITSQSSIINIEKGQTLTLEAALSGTQINASDIYDISWKTNDPNIVSLLATENNVTKGKNCYITAKNPGETVISVTHPKCKTALEIWVIIPQKNEVDITLDTKLIEVYKDDGAQTVSATLLNGTASDYASISWTAPKVGGQNIISISRSNGKTCNIIPRNVGQTTLRAQLPNGKYADCIISVSAAAEIVLSTKAVHVNPGYSETISYSINPEAASINWISQGTGSADASEFFSFYVNEAAKTITITGNKLGSGTISGYFVSTSGGMTAKLSVYVEYTYKFELQTKGTLTKEPRNGTEIEIPFKVYPADLVMSATPSDPNRLEVKTISVDPKTGLGKVVVTPLKEGMGLNITIKATNPDDSKNTPLIRTQYIDLYYNKITINPIFTLKSGSFSNYDGQTLYLGDGDDILFHLDVAEDNVDISKINVSWRSIGGSYQDNSEAGFIKLVQEKEMSDAGITQWRLQHTNDYTTENAYLITQDLFIDVSHTRYWTERVKYQYETDGNYYDGYRYEQRGDTNTTELSTSNPNQAITGWVLDEKRTLTDGINGNTKRLYLKIIGNDTLQKLEPWASALQDFLINDSGTKRYENTMTGDDDDLKTGDLYEATWKYKKVTPYVISEENLKNNPNYFRKMFSGTEYNWGNWIPSKNSWTKTYDETKLHRYASATVTKDPAIVTTLRGEIYLSYKTVEGSLCERAIPITIQIRNCEAFNNNKWYYRSDTQRWYQN